MKLPVSSLGVCLHCLMQNKELPQCTHTHMLLCYDIVEAYCYVRCDIKQTGLDEHIMYVCMRSRINQSTATGCRTFRPCTYVRRQVGLCQLHTKVLYTLLQTASLMKMTAVQSLKRLNYCEIPWPSAYQMIMLRTYVHTYVHTYVRMYVRMYVLIKINSHVV